MSELDKACQAFREMANAMGWKHAQEVRLAHQLGMTVLQAREIREADDLRRAIRY